ncbi:MAG: chorismate synthase [Myxococcota bacterium]
MGRLRLLTAGESHGPKMVAIIEGLPAGLKLDFSLLEHEMSRRLSGYGRGFRARSIERDQVMVNGGVRFGETIGAPVLLEVVNNDHEKWRGVMEATPIADRSKAEAKAIRRPRPGHADLVGALKYGRADLRDALERASARSTVVRVAAGAVAKTFLKELGIEVCSMVTRIGPAAWPIPSTTDLWAYREAAESSDVRCPDPETADAMRAAIDDAQRAKDTVGGSFLVIAQGVPTGLGSYADWDRKLDGRLAQAVMSIPAVKAVEIGNGAEAGKLPGSQVHDEIIFDPAHRKNGSGGFARRTNRAGGLEAGVTNGAELVVHGTMKPIATLGKPLETVSLDDKHPAPATYERSDVCAVPACAVIAEAAVAFCVADAVLESYGGDTMNDVVSAHRERVERYGHS